MKPNEAGQPANIQATNDAKEDQPLEEAVSLLRDGVHLSDTGLAEVVVAELDKRIEQRTANLVNLNERLLLESDKEPQDEGKLDDIEDEQELEEVAKNKLVMMRDAIQEVFPV